MCPCTFVYQKINYEPCNLLIWKKYVCVINNNRAFKRTAHHRFQEEWREVEGDNKVPHNRVIIEILISDILSPKGG